MSSRVLRAAALSWITVISVTLTRWSYSPVILLTNGDEYAALEYARLPVRIKSHCFSKYPHADNLALSARSVIIRDLSARAERAIGFKSPTSGVCSIPPGA